MRNLRALSPTKRRFGRFVLVGAIGFGVNTVGVALLVSRTGPYAAQAWAYALATGVTFALNRGWVFRDAQAPAHGAVGGPANPSAQAVRYVLSSLWGALVVNAVYATGIHAGLPWFLALGVGAVSAAVSSFVVLSRWVFRAPRQLTQEGGSTWD